MMRMGARRALRPLFLLNNPDRYAKCMARRFDVAPDPRVVLGLWAIAARPAPWAQRLEKALTRLESASIKVQEFLNLAGQAESPAAAIRSGAAEPVRAVLPAARGLVAGDGGQGERR